MNRELRFTPEARRNLEALENSRSKAGVLKQVRKTLALLETNLRHPSLQTHLFHSLIGPNGEEVFEACVQQQTPAYRVFFYYGPDRLERGKRIPALTIVAITPHP
jgi:hypothetical protein